MVKGPYPEGEWKFPSARRPSASAGTDVTVLDLWRHGPLSMEAVAPLAIWRVSIEVIDLRSLNPLDWATIEFSVKKTSRVLIVHEDNEFVGYGAELAAQVADKAFEWLDAPVRRYAPPTYLPSPSPKRWRT